MIKSESLILYTQHGIWGFYVDWIIKSDLLPWISKHFKMRAACVLILFCLHHQIKGFKRNRRSHFEPWKRKSGKDFNINQTVSRWSCVIRCDSIFTIYRQCLTRNVPHNSQSQTPDCYPFFNDQVTLYWWFFTCKKSLNSSENSISYIFRLNFWPWNSKFLTIQV